MPRHEVSINLDGKKYSLETGKMAKFANGSVMVTCEDTKVLVTTTCSSEPREVSFLPLAVEYRENTAAAGKIPGGFFKREGRPTEKEILTARLIDRPIRPMLPKTWRYETQIIAGVYSADPSVEAGVLAALGASASLLISDIPFSGPISEVTVGRIDGKFVINPTLDELENSDIEMVVAGTDTAITMVEGESREISEDEFLEGLEYAHDKIKELNALQLDLQKAFSKEKIEFEEVEIPEDLISFTRDLVENDIDDYIHKDTAKEEREGIRKIIFDKAIETAQEKYEDDEEMLEVVEKYVKEIVSEFEKEKMRAMIIKDGKRLDGRKLTDIRQIDCEVGILPRTHGSALFTRGETQSLTTITLGTSRDEQLIDGLLPTYNEHIMLHYNFPPFSTGETGRMNVSRREVGHGHLALRALRNLLPKQEDFPYTIRIVSDILESNGSSSMATVCAGTLGLFDAGVPLKKPVAGIAMGLIKEDDDVAILSDILGDEDFLGDMDFKVTGTAQGITAFQMDIKIEGLSIDIMKEALSRAKEGRFHILNEMNKVMPERRDDLSPFAPRFRTIKVPQDMISVIIGSGGETIRSITKETETEINIEDNGTVIIAATTGEAADKAEAIIKSLTQKPEEGKVYTGKVKEIREGLGAFVEILPKRSGLLHISQIAHERVENVEDYLSVGEEIEVKLMEMTRDGKYRLSRKAILPRPEGMPEDRGSRDRRGGNRRDDRRSGGGRDRRR